MFESAKLKTDIPEKKLYQVYIQWLITNSPFCQL